MINKRKNIRQIIQQSARSDLVRNDLDSSSRLRLRPVVTNLSFGGMGLLFLPSLGQDEIKELHNGDANLHVEMNLPPSTRTIGVTGKVRWFRQKAYQGNYLTFMGIEFINKSTELYREIDRFLKSPAPTSELFKNKRSFPRIHSDIKAEFELPGIKRFHFFRKKNIAEIFNISAQGAQLNCLSRLSEKERNILNTPGTVFPLKFYLPTASKWLHLACRPVHCAVAEKNGKELTVIGLKFVQLSEQDQIHLIEYVCIRKNVYLKKEIEKMGTQAA